MIRKLLLLAIIVAHAGFLTAQNQTIIRYLTGTGKDNTVEWDFYCSDGMQSGEWKKIAVPSCWELQGFGNYNYGHDHKFNKQVYNEHGLYKHSFDVPSDWKKNEVKIVFQGVMTDAEVKINGKLAGEIHQGAFYEFKYSISKLLKFGKENLLEVKVNKVSANESINAAERRADFWIFGGIFRPVYLEVLPAEHIERVAIDAKASGDLTAELHISSKKAEQVSLTLNDIRGNKIQDLPVQKLKKGTDRWIVSSTAEDIETWNPEKPDLYQLQISLLDKKGTTLHNSLTRIGFRTVEVRESDGIYVNGVPIKFKGVNRHSFYPSSGRTTSKALSIEHVKMMKDMNMNAVRMSHYPPDAHFLDVCDSLGLFVIDEVCTWHNPYLDTEVGKKIIKEAVIRDVNHPSILIWANGNESGWNRALDDEYAKWDMQKREVIHPWSVFRKTNTMHYPEYHIFAYDAPTKDKVYFPTEFLHGLYDGGHGAGLDDYWKMMWNMPLGAGGFLWDFADEAVVRTDRNGELDTDGNHGADGIVGPYGEKEGSYYTIKEIWSPIYIANRYIRDDFSGIFRLENRYHFTKLDECSLTARWVNFNGPLGSTAYSVMSESKVKLPALDPGNKGTFTVEKPENWRSADALYLTAVDPHGMEIFTWSYPVRPPKEINKTNINYSKAGKIGAKSTEDQVEVITENVRFMFSAKNGLLMEVYKEDLLIPLKDGPVILGGKSEFDKVELDVSDDKVVIKALYKPRKRYWDWKENNETTQDFIKWTVHSNGLLDLHVEVRHDKVVKEYTGIGFTFPEEEVEGMKCLANGPYRVWRNRMKGTRMHVWENNYNNTITGRSGFEYPEFKGFYANLNWVKVNGRSNNGFTVYCHSDNTYLRMLTPEEPDDALRGSAVKVFPAGDISFMKNIPPIGTKFKEAEMIGPQSYHSYYFGNNDDPITMKLTFEF